jgi:positive regulator of sigma E activity
LNIYIFHLFFILFYFILFYFCNKKKSQAALADQEGIVVGVGADVVTLKLYVHSSERKQNNQQIIIKIINKPIILHMP